MIVGPWGAGAGQEAGDESEAEACAGTGIGGVRVFVDLEEIG